MKKIIIFFIAITSIPMVFPKESFAQNVTKRLKLKICFTPRGELVVKKRCRRPEVPFNINTLAGEINIREGITERAGCQAPFIKGVRCNKRRNLFYFYNKDTNVCEQRSYCIPNVNTNIFRTLEECQEACVQ